MQLFALFPKRDGERFVHMRTADRVSHQPA